jgi:hypothetical protein
MCLRSTEHMRTHIGNCTYVGLWPLRQRDPIKPIQKSLNNLKYQVLSLAVAAILVYSINSISTLQSFRASKTLTHTTFLDCNRGNTRINMSTTQHHHHCCHISVPSQSPLSSLLSSFLTISTQNFETNFSTDPKLTDSYDITGNQLFTKPAIIMRSILRNTNGTHKWMRPKL